MAGRSAGGLRDSGGDAKRQARLRKRLDSQGKPKEEKEADRQEQAASGATAPEPSKESSGKEVQAAFNIQGGWDYKPPPVPEPLSDKDKAVICEFMNTHHSEEAKAFVQAWSELGGVPVTRRE